MISKWFNKTIEVQRDTYTEVDGFWKSGLTTVGTIKGHIQQASPELVSNMGLNFSLSHSIWLPIESTVKTNDILLIEGKYYGVRAIQVNGTGSNKHLEVTAEMETEITS